MDVGKDVGGPAEALVECFALQEDGKRRATVESTGDDAVRLIDEVAGDVIGGGPVGIAVLSPDFEGLVDDVAEISSIPFAALGLGLVHAEDVFQIETERAGEVIAKPGGRGQAGGGDGRRAPLPVVGFAAQSGVGWFDGVEEVADMARERLPAAGE